MTIVLSTGEYLTSIIRNQYADLFWALLGGGGGIYAILTSVTYRTYPSLPVAAAVMSIKTVRANTIQALFTELLRINPQLPDAGRAGYDRITNNHVLFLRIAPNVSATIASESMQPFFQHATNMACIVSQQTYVSQYPSWDAWLTQFFTNGTQNGVHLVIEPRLLTPQMLESKYQELSDILFPLGTTWGCAYLGAIWMNTHLRIQPRRFLWCEFSLAKGCCSRCVRCLVARGDVFSKHPRHGCRR